MEFWERVETERLKQSTTYRWIAENVVKRTESTVSGWRINNILPRADDAVKIAQALGTSVEYLVTGNVLPVCTESIAENMPTYGFKLFDSKGNESSFDDTVIMVPILSQRVAAGNGQEYQDTIDIIGRLPFLARMLRGEKASNARAVEVRGDSMTGVQLFDGDLVVYVPGVIRGDGIYVLQVSSELLVKRVQFDLVSRKLRIISENPRYPDRVESADGQAAEIVGKVFGWLHAHPY